MKWLIIVLFLCSCGSKSEESIRNDEIENKGKRAQKELQQIERRKEMEIIWIRQQLPAAEIKRKVDSMYVVDSIYLNTHY
jgi:hypothetical protein